LLTGNQFTNSLESQRRMRMASTAREVWRQMLEKWIAFGLCVMAAGLMSCQGLQENALQKKLSKKKLRRKWRRGATLFLGKTPRDDPRIYFEASPMSYVPSHVTGARNKTSFLLTWGTADQVADAKKS
jgi:hypothetical protein